ncbi:MAG: glutamate-1-semialdehyde 2,1-aminomutase [Candidatus Bathyarchaeota archaeon]|nr:glutamate-1-semialdehyde 2,1-aminomutase [Candidatus Bathyarchaeota archaeon]
MGSGLGSKSLFEKASKLMPGGVNSPVRMFKPYPFFTQKATGSKHYDVDGNSYIDYCMAYGAIIFGHSYPPIIQAVKKKLDLGTVYGTPTEAEVQLAELITDSLPCAEMVRLVNSGAEATMHSIRLARGYTGRKRIIKFDGCYHGAHDSVLVKAGSGAASFGIPTSQGISEDTTKNTLVVPYNSVPLLQEIFEKEGDEIAAIIVEPVIGNMGVIPPSKSYLNELRRIADQYNALLIFDEIITGFRLAIGGAQEYYQVTPDLVTLGKVLGGGFPISAIAGKRKIMEHFSPIGKVYQAGTFSGNAISVVAAIETINELKRKNSNLYDSLEQFVKELTNSLRDFISKNDMNVQINNIASMFTVFFTDIPVTNSDGARSCDNTKFMKFHSELMKRGIFFPPSQFESCFVTTSHNKEDLNKTIDTTVAALKAI